jgi:endoglucanase
LQQLKKKEGNLLEAKDFLQKIAGVFSVSGKEEELSTKLQEEFLPFVDETKIDNLGNLITFKKGESNAAPKVMLAAHMDEIGLIVTKIEKRGFLRFSTVGGIDSRTLAGQRVIMHAPEGAIEGVISAVPPHLTKMEERKEAYKFEQLFITPLLDEEEVKTKIPVGTLATVKTALNELCGSVISGRTLDDRAGIAAIYLTLQKLQNLKHKAHLYAVITVQEEVGTRGAITSAFGIEPDLALAVEVTHADLPGSDRSLTTKMGEGPVIYTGPNIHPVIEEKLRRTAKEIKAKYQLKAASGPTGTDARAFQVSKGGIASGLVSVPLRYMHTPVETLDLNDLEETSRLLAHFMSGIDHNFKNEIIDF